MAIVGFNFTQIKAERGKESAKGKIDIKNNVAITNVEESKLSLGGSAQKTARFTFDFSALYEPKVGSIKFTGEVLYLAETAKIDELVKNWQKNKKVPNEIMPAILNTVLNRCNIQALILSQQVNLPPPIPMPKVQAAPQKEAAKK